MAKNDSSPAPAFSPLGDGIEFAVSDGVLTLRIKLNAEAARASASGKMVLAGSTGGWVTIPGTDGWRTNVNVGRKAA